MLKHETGKPDERGLAAGERGDVPDYSFRIERVDEVDTHPVGGVIDLTQPVSVLGG